MLTFRACAPLFVMEAYWTQVTQSTQCVSNFFNKSFIVSSLNRAKPAPMTEPMALIVEAEL